MIFNIDFMMRPTQELVVPAKVVLICTSYEYFITPSVVYNEKPEKFNGLNFKRW